MERFTITADDGEELAVMRWDACAPVRTVVQLAHGAAEHLGRYDRLARFLAERGHAVVGADHRGHGTNADLHGQGCFGPDGFAAIVADMRRVTEVGRAAFPSRPVVLLGHSFGSFAAQIYLMRHGQGIDGLVLSGTAAVDLLLAGADLGSGLTSANALFEPARTPFDWLSRDAQEVDAYMADPLCGFDLAPDSLATMPRVVSETMEKHDLASAAARRLPVYIVSGQRDPVVGPGQRLSRALARRYRTAGLDVKHRIYTQGRHEMFNETNRDEVMRDFVQWLDARF
jgi:alpha-beta hydrolase superfamily lysophospholipase